MNWIPRVSPQQNRVFSKDILDACVVPSHGGKTGSALAALITTAASGTAVYYATKEQSGEVAEHVRQLGYEVVTRDETLHVSGKGITCKIHILTLPAAKAIEHEDFRLKVEDFYFKETKGTTT